MLWDKISCYCIVKRGSSFFFFVGPKQGIVNTGSRPVIGSCFGSCSKALMPDILFNKKELSKPSIVAGKVYAKVNEILDVSLHKYPLSKILRHESVRVCHVTDESLS